MTGLPPDQKRQKAEHRGRAAEAAAALMLRAKGYRILERRFKCRAGEIDIVAQRGETFVFVEVKARQTIEQAIESITPHQRKRIEAAAEAWLRKATSQQFAVRFDVIAVAPRTLPSHMMDAWRPGW